VLTSGYGSDILNFVAEEHRATKKEVKNFKKVVDR
jgi:hypothetical protein